MAGQRISLMSLSAEDLSVIHYSALVEPWGGSLKRNDGLISASPFGGGRSGVVRVEIRGRNHAQPHEVDAICRNWKTCAPKAVGSTWGGRLARHELPAHNDGNGAPREVVGQTNSPTESLPSEDLPHQVGCPNTVLCTAPCSMPLKSRETSSSHSTAHEAFNSPKGAPAQSEG